MNYKIAFWIVLGLFVWHVWYNLRTGGYTWAE